MVISRAAIREMLDEILVRQDKAVDHDEGVRLEELGFRSLDFAELALRVEDACGRPLEFEAGELRVIETVKDVLDFMESVVRDGA